MTKCCDISNALAQQNEVVCLDIVADKVAMLNRKESPIEDFLKNKPLNFRATLDKQDASFGADYVIIAKVTDYDPETNHLNTQSIEAVIRDIIFINPQAVMVIKCTIPVGYTVKTRVAFGTKNLIFSTSFSAKAKLFTTNCTLRALSSANNPPAPKPSPTC
jgi:UDPglucose 6-dehydrogenase